MAAQGEASFARFQSWADLINDGERVSSRRMAAVTGHVPMTYVQAKSRDTLNPQHVITYARGIGESPVAALRAALPWPFLPQDVEPRDDEWLSQVPHEALLLELAGRLGEVRAEYAWPTEGTSVARWLEVLTPRTAGTARGVADAVGIEYRSYVTKKSRGSFTLAELRDLAAMGACSYRMALVAQGVLTWEEVGLDGGRRASVLSSVGTDALLDYVEASLAPMRRAIRRIEDKK